MTNSARRVLALVAATAVGLMLALTGTAAADGDDHRKDDKKCAQGEATGDGTTVLPGGIPFNKFVFDVCRTGPATSDVTGFFRAVTQPLQQPMVSGPVTCAAFDGKTVSFLYPLDENSGPPPFGPPNAILIVATDGGPAPADDKLGFVMGPEPVTFGNNCDLSTLPAAVASKITPLPLGEGQIKVDSKP